MPSKADQAVLDKTDQLSFGRKLGYGLGGSASNFIWQMISLYMLYFYTDVFGIPAAVAATIFLVARIWDAVNDPFMGFIADQTRSKWGKFRPYLLFGSIPLAVVFVITFTTPDLSASGKIIYAVVTYILLGMIYTVVNIPYNSLAAVITQNTNERSSLAAVMLILTYITVLIIAVATIPLVNLFPTEQLGFSFTVGIYAFLSMIMFMVCFASTREKASLVKRERHGFGSEIKLVSRNKYLLILISAVFFTSAANEMRTTAAIYFFKYNIGDENLFPLFMFVVAFSMILGATLTPMLGRKLGSKRNLYYIGTLLPVIAGSGILFIPFENLPAIILLSAVGSVGGGITFVLIWSMIADTVEYGEWKTGIRGEGIIYSTLTFITKMAYAAGGALAGMLLSWAGYVPNIVQSPQVQRILLYMLALFPIISGILAICIMAFYKIDVKFYGEILKQINERKEKQEAVARTAAVSAADA